MADSERPIIVGKIIIPRSMEAVNMLLPFPTKYKIKKPYFPKGRYATCKHKDTNKDYRYNRSSGGDKKYYRHKFFKKIFLHGFSPTLFNMAPSGYFPYKYLGNIF